MVDKSNKYADTVDAGNNSRAQRGAATARVTKNPRCLGSTGGMTAGNTLGDKVRTGSLFERPTQTTH